MNRTILEERTKAFHIKVLKFIGSLPKNLAAYEIGKQLIRSAGSIAANYRASKRAKSTPDFLYKIELVLEEADESHYWLSVLRDSEISNSSVLDELIDEANQITAIFAATSRTTKIKIGK